MKRSRESCGRPDRPDNRNISQQPAASETRISARATTPKNLVCVARSLCRRLHKSLCISRRRCKQGSSRFASPGKQDVAVFFWPIAFCGSLSRPFQRRGAQRRTARPLRMAVKTCTTISQSLCNLHEFSSGYLRKLSFLWRLQLAAQWNKKRKFSRKDAKTQMKKIA